jgi:hypothetical protein
MLKTLLSAHGNSGEIRRPRRTRMIDRPVQRPVFERQAVLPATVFEVTY